jgi:hypothetical protein
VAQFKRTYRNCRDQDTCPQHCPSFRGSPDRDLSFIGTQLRVLQEDRIAADGQVNRSTSTIADYRSSGSFRKFRPKSPMGLASEIVRSDRPGPGARDSTAFPWSIFDLNPSTETENQSYYTLRPALMSSLPSPFGSRSTSPGVSRANRSSTHAMSPLEPV